MFKSRSGYKTRLSLGMFKSRNGIRLVDIGGKVIMSMIGFMMQVQHIRVCPQDGITPMIGATHTHTLSIMTKLVTIFTIGLMAQVQNIRVWPDIPVGITAVVRTTIQRPMTTTIVSILLRR